MSTLSGLTRAELEAWAAHLEQQLHAPGVTWLRLRAEDLALINELYSYKFRWQNARRDGVYVPARRAWRWLVRG